MGFAMCRFSSETGCKELGSQEYHINLPDVSYKINVPSMWKHYMVDHLVQPTAQERKVIMSADPAKATGELMQTRSIQPSLTGLQVMYVEEHGSGYSHKVGTEPDWEFIKKLESILACTNPLQTKGVPQTVFR